MLALNVAHQTRIRVDRLADYLFVEGTIRVLV